MKGDVSIFGLTMGHYFIEDISVMVPHMEVVVVPAATAFKSKDLWRAINMRRVFHLHAGAKSWPAGAVPAPIQIDQTKLLEQALEEQRAQNAAVLQAMSEQGALVKRLTETVANLQGVSVASVAAQAVQQDTPEGEAPVFVPSTMKPDVTEQRIRGREDTSEGSAVSGARTRLRELRAKR